MKKTILCICLLLGSLSAEESSVPQAEKKLNFKGQLDRLSDRDNKIKGRLESTLLLIRKTKTTGLDDQIQGRRFYALPKPRKLGKKLSLELELERRHRDQRKKDILNTPSVQARLEKSSQAKGVRRNQEGRKGMSSNSKKTPNAKSSDTKIQNLSY